MPRLILTFTTAAALLLPAPGQAADTLELDLPAALALARRHAPDLLTAHAEATASEGALIDARRPLRHDPVLSVGGGPRIGEDGAVPDLEAGITQVFELGGRGAARRDAAEAGVAAAAAGVDDLERRLLAQVAEAFLHARYARARVDLLRASAEVADEVRTVALRRHRAGDVGGIEPGLAAVAAHRAEARLSRAEAEAVAAEGVLRARLGLGPQPALVLVGTRLAGHALAEGGSADTRTAAADAGTAANAGATDGGDARPLPDAGTLLELAERRADLAALTAEVRAAKAQARLARSRAWPDVGVSLGWSREEGDDVVGAGLSVPLPVTGEGRGAAVAAARRADLLEEALAARRRAVRSEVEAALASARALQEAAERAQAEQVGQTAEVATSARVAYEAGAMPLAELLAIRRELLDARLGHLEVALAAERARVALLAAAGWPTDGTVVAEVIR